MVAATGIGSGLDIESLVTQLVAAERAPAENRLLRQESEFTSELSAFGTFKGALGGFENSLAALNTLTTFTQRTATSTDSAIVTASATSDAVPASYAVEVDQLASAQSLASGAFTSTTETVGDGTLTLRFGTTDYTPADPGPESYNGFTVNTDRDPVAITIDSSNNTVQGVADAINGADAGVNAVIVNDQGGVRLLISSEETGAANSIEISVDDTGDNDDDDALGLSRLAFNASANNLSQTVAGEDALFRINGLSLSSAGNTADDVIDGVNLTFTGTSSGSAATVTVDENRGAVRQAIESFVSAYNSFISTANNLTRYDQASGIAGPLQGDFTARSIISQVRNGVTGAAQGNTGAFSTIAEIGITTTDDGTLSIDDARLDAALADNFENVAGIFTRAGRSSTTNLSVLDTSSATQIGTYEVLTTVSGISSGSLTGADITPIGNANLRIDNGNRTLGLRVDGVDRTVNFTRATYVDADAIAAMMQTDINAAYSGTGISVAVSFNGSAYEITSQSLGSSSTVEITSLDNRTTTELGFSLGAGTPGADGITGATIGGEPATIDGNILTGAVGTAVEGLRINVGTLTAGSLGTITVSQGIVGPLDSILGGYLESNGILDARTDGLQSSVDRIADDREALDRRLESIEARFRRQFNALDTLLANIQSTGTFLTQQLANIPVPGVNSDN